MKPDRKKRPRDPSQLAKLIVDIATGEVEDKSGLPPKSPAAISRGHLGGIKGGVARSKSLSKARRIEIAKKAATTRWKRKSKKG